MSATLLIMAAGLGSRYGGNKQVDTLGPNGEILMEYSIFDAVSAGFDKVVFVIRKQMEPLFRQMIGDKIAARVKEVAYAYQEGDTLPQGFVPPAGRTKPYGTVHAVYCAKSLINEPFAVINADDYYGKTAFQTLYPSLLKNQGNRALMVAYQLINTLSENGSVTRGVCTQNTDGTLKRVTETYQITKAADGIRDLAENRPLDPNALVSMNFWGFAPSIFNLLEEGMGNFVKTLADDDLKSEYPLPVLVDTLIKANRLAVDVLKTDAIWFGVTYPDDKATVQKALQNLHEQGAYPAKL